jgi:hypothetical protein
VHDDDNDNNDVGRYIDITQTVIRINRWVERQMGRRIGGQMAGKKYTEMERQKWID